jgi:hypothetical protein
MKKLNKVNVPAYHKERHECFGACPTFVDEKMLMAGLFSFDIFALEQWLERKHGKIPDDVSVKDFLQTHYGDRSVRFVEKWLCSDQFTVAPAFVGEVAVTDPDTKDTVHLAVYKDPESKGMFAVDSSFIEQTERSMIPSPFDHNTVFSLEAM